MKTGCEWKALEQVEVHLQHKVLLGGMARGIDPTQHDQWEGKVQTIAGEGALLCGRVATNQCIAMRQQGPWTRWDHVMEQNV